MVNLVIKLMNHQLFNSWSNKRSAKWSTNGQLVGPPVGAWEGHVVQLFVKLVVHQLSNRWSNKCSRSWSTTCPTVGPISVPHVGPSVSPPVEHQLGH